MRLFPTSLGVFALGLGSLLLGTQAIGEDAQSETAPADAKPVPTPKPELKAIEYQLENGLTVILSEDHTLPFVATEVVYLVGSGHERKGRTGFAHLFEHLMFQGSANYDKEFFTDLEPIGAKVNGTTNMDRTNYYEQVPSQYQELPLWLESDRMRSLLPALTQEKLNNQRDVVKNERRQRYETPPYGMFFWYLTEGVFPEGHPYHHTTIGSHEDLSAATLDDVKEFFEQYYVPANAALIIAGDFDETKTREMIEKYFGDIPAGKRAPTPTAPPVEINQITHYIVEDQVSLPQVSFSWPTPAIFQPGDAELDLLSNVLTEGKTSRLYKELVYGTDKVKSVSAFQWSRKLASNYVVQLTGTQGTTADELAELGLAALEKVTATPPTALELESAKNNYKKLFFKHLEEYSSRASLLGSYYLQAGKSDQLATDFNRYQDASAAAVQKGAKELLPLDRYVRIDIVPGKKSTEVKKTTTPPTAPDQLFKKETTK